MSRKRLLALWAFLAEYYGRQLSDTALAMYAEDVADLEFEEVERAMHEYRRNPANRTLPLPAQIRAIARPESVRASNKALATEAAARIIAACAKFGWNNPTEARAFMGELAWKVLDMQGGWIAHCESTQPTGVIQAQYARLAEAILERGGDLSAPGLPAGVAPAGEKATIESGTMTAIAKLLEKPNGQAGS